MTAWKIVVTIGAAVVALVLWFLVPVVYGHPSTNEALDLSSLGPLLLLIVLLGGLASIGTTVAHRSSAAVPLSLGLLGAGAGGLMLAGLAQFGNTGDDRFMALLFLPYVAIPLGAVPLLVGVLVRSAAGGEVRGAVLRGFIALAVIAAWLFARGSRDWLLAPYGFDWFCVIALAAAVLTVTGWRRTEGRTALGQS